MSYTPHMRRRENAAYSPYETRVDYRWRCSICGFAGIDPEKWQEPDTAVFSTTTTGTVYQIPVGTPVNGLGVVNRATETVVGTYSGCPHCGSPAWSWGYAPDLRW